MPGGRRVDAQVPRKVWQQAHGGEFGGADGKAANGQREMDQIRMSRIGR
jgi:hypothetical protein